MTQYFTKYTASRIDGHRIYGLSGYMVNFWLFPNGMGFHTIRFFWIYDQFCMGNSGLIDNKTDGIIYFWSFWSPNSFREGWQTRK